MITAFVASPIFTIRSKSNAKAWPGFTEEGVKLIILPVIVGFISAAATITSISFSSSFPKSVPKS